ncbi:MAG: glycosyltransferase family 4 protein [Proteobacteria bacterium]|nr:glycosyltransferase family 4 protein [Pseudomonadota bacterium]
MIVLSHPTGNANSRAAALALAQHSQLSAFHTCIATFSDDWLDRLAGLPGMGELRRRTFDPSLRRLTRSWPWREAARLLASRAGASALVAHERGPFSVDAVYASLDRRVAATLGRQGAPRAVYAYEDGALASFQAAKPQGIACLYDLPIGYWRTARRLLAGELERWPEWASTLTGLADSQHKLLRKDEELRLADRIFVASSFTRKSLEDFPGQLAPIEVIPYGFPPAAPPKTTTRKEGDPIRLLFVGGLSQRKGIADLFAVMDRVGDAAQLTVVGRNAGPPNPALDAALAKHRWIPSLPHAQVLEQMREHDVLVFPSLFEGFGLVITEAMSQGTPVVTTDRTAGADLIEHGRNGWLFEAGSTRRLAAIIEGLINRPGQIEAAGQAALEAARRRTWADYGSELAAAVARAVEQHGR